MMGKLTSDSLSFLPPCPFILTPGGSALNGGSSAVSACVSTQIGAVSSGCVWLLLSMWRGKPACSALMNGLLAGLAGITPASGYINSPRRHCCWVAY